MIPFLDLASIHAELRNEIDQAISGVVDSGRFLLGEQTQRFEEELAESIGVKFAVSVGSGVDALFLALAAAGIGEGDEVIVPSHTFIATWLAVSRCGATIVPVEPDPATLNIEPQRITSALTARTAAIVPVHLYGQPAQMSEICELAQRAGVAVIADGAQSLGATIDGVNVERFGLATVTSFYPGKNLGGLGDGGCVFTDDQATANQIRKLRNYGADRAYHHEILGVNSRLDEIQAAVLRVKLPHLRRWNARRQRIAERYRAELGNESISVLKVLPGYQSSWHIFPILSDRRDQLADDLRAMGIQTHMHYPICPADSGAYAGSAFHTPLAARIAETELSLPIGPSMTDDAVQEVIDAMNSLAVV